MKSDLPSDATTTNNYTSSDIIDAFNYTTTISFNKIIFIDIKSKIIFQLL